MTKDTSHEAYGRQISGIFGFFFTKEPVAHRDIDRKTYWFLKAIANFTVFEP